MFQLYLLTVLTNVLAGLALSNGFLSKKFTRFSEYMDFMMNKPYRVIVGVLSLIVAIINLFRTYPGDIPVISELLPSLTGIVAGILLIVEFKDSSLIEEAGKSVEVMEKVQKFSKPYLTIVGLLALLAGILHAVIPTVGPF